MKNIQRNNHWFHSLVALGVAAAFVAIAPAWAATPDGQGANLGTKDCPYVAASLGKCLTPWGAIKAGSPDGKIPAYTGGLKTPPAGADVKSGDWPDPFKDEKPILRIDHTNMAQYKDKLSAGVMYLMKKYPDFYINVYPTHRTAWYPQVAIEGMLANVKRARMDGKNHVVGAKGPGFPFPIAKSGVEAQWNSNLRYRWPYSTAEFEEYAIDSSGQLTLIARNSTDARSAYNLPDWDGPADANYMLVLRTSAPAISAGQALLEVNIMDYRRGNQKTYVYSPATRRVTLAPEISYDTPVALANGTIFGDETDTFAGNLGKYDWKIVGRKEMYVPYNDYAFKSGDHAADTAYLAHYPNPKLMRWELHRVYVLEATLASGERHVEVKKTFYIDEDTWTEVLWDAWDASGKLYRSMWDPFFNSYFPKYPNSYEPGEVVFDFANASYAEAAYTGCKGCNVKLVDSIPDHVFTRTSLKQSAF